MTFKITEPRIENINLEEYLYQLPEKQIAKFPLTQRDQSKLLVYQNGTVQHKIFQDIANFIPTGSTLFFNDTKVIPARLYFEKDTGAQIEIFLLQPTLPLDISQTMKANSSCKWSTMIGNLKRWPPGTKLTNTLTISGKTIDLQAELIDKDEKIVVFSWTGQVAFSEILEAVGKVPIPPYLKREATPLDKSRYQTVYSIHQGAVAAPTAGLHFTKETFDRLKAKEAKCDYLTLHVSAGTFQPIKETKIERHPMHSEQIIITMDNIRTLLKADKVIAIGTTSMRTLESLYWYGVKLSHNLKAPFHIEKLLPYQFGNQDLPTLQDSCRKILEYMTANNLTSLSGSTEIFIFPGYRFRACQGLVTNFHLPGSTLILLVAAFIGRNWRSIYDQAVKHNYRFLSYGDTSLLLPGA